MKARASILIMMLIIITQSAFTQPERHNPDREKKFTPKIERHYKVFSQIGVLNNLKFEQPKLLQLNYQDLWYDDDYIKSEQWMDSYRNIIEYDGEFVSEVLHEWFNYTENEWVISEIDYYEYEHGMISQVIKLHTDYETGEIVNNRKTEFSFIFLNGRYYMSQMIFSRWNRDANDWIPDFKAEPTYDSVDLTGILSYSYENGEFVVEDRSVFTQQGNHVVEVIEVWDGNSFENDERITYLDTQRQELYDMLTSEINDLDLGYSLMRYYMHPKPNMIEEVWNGEEWVMDIRISYITEEGSDPDNYVFKYLGEEYWNDTWNPRYMVEFPVVDGFVMSATSHFGYDGIFYPDEREEFTYDNRGLMIWSYVGYSNDEGGFNLDERVFLTWSGSDVSVPTHPDLPVRVSLGNAYPNPFNPSVNLPFELSENALVKIEIFDITGRKMATVLHAKLDAGSHTIRFNAKNFASGLYLVKFQAGNQLKTTQITLIK